MVYENKRPDVAVFIDFENVYVSVRDKLDANPNFETIMDRCDDLGRVVIARAYADWYRYPRVTSALYANGIEPMYVPTYYYDKEMGRTGRAIKNSVDMNLCIDAMKTLFTNMNIEKFVLATGDRDFIPLVNSIRQQGKEVIIIGIGGAASAHLAQSADEFIFYEQLVGKVAPPPTNGRQRSRAPEQVRSLGEQLPPDEVKPVEPVPPPEPDVYDTLVDAVHLVRKRGYVSTLGSLKLVMKELMGGDFKESRYRDLNGRPFAKFKDFVLDAERRGKVIIFTSGTVNEVFLPGEDPLKLSQFAADLKEEPVPEAFDEATPVGTINGQFENRREEAPEVPPVVPPASTTRRRRRRSRSQRKAEAEAAAQAAAAEAAEAVQQEEATAQPPEVMPDEFPTEVPAWAYTELEYAAPLSDDEIRELLAQGEIDDLVNVSEALTLSGSEHRVEPVFGEEPPAGEELTAFPPEAPPGDLPSEEMLAAEPEGFQEPSAWDEAVAAQQPPAEDVLPEVPVNEAPFEGEWAAESPPVETETAGEVPPTADADAAMPEVAPWEAPAEELPAEVPWAPEAPPAETEAAGEVPPVEAEGAAVAAMPEAAPEELPAEESYAEAPWVPETPSAEIPEAMAEASPIADEPVPEVPALAEFPPEAPPGDLPSEEMLVPEPAPEPQPAEAEVVQELPAWDEQAAVAAMPEAAPQEMPASVPPPAEEWATAAPPVETAAESAPEPETVETFIETAPAEDTSAAVAALPEAIPPPEPSDEAPEPEPTETDEHVVGEGDEELGVAEVQVYFADEEWQAFTTMMAGFTKPASFAQIFDALRELRKQEALTRTNEQLRTMVKQAINRGLLERNGRGKRVYYKLKQDEA